MMELPQFTSITDRLLPGEDRPGRLLVLGSLVATLMSSVSSLVAYGLLSDRIRIHWTLGTGSYYYGPEFAPTVLVLSLFPSLIGGFALVAYWLDTRLSHDAQFATVRPYYVAVMVGVTGLLLASHIALIVANL